MCQDAFGSCSCCLQASKFAAPQGGATSPVYREEAFNRRKNGRDAFLFLSSLHQDSQGDGFSPPCTNSLAKMLMLLYNTFWMDFIKGQRSWASRIRSNSVTIKREPEKQWLHRPPSRPFFLKIIIYFLFPTVKLIPQEVRNFLVKCSSSDISKSGEHL